MKITDFGIARASDGLGLTGTGQVMGTPQYLSPEQARGSTATPASDVYSLGVVAFECLVGHRPFDAESPVATALAHLNDPVPDLPRAVPSDLAAIVRRAMAKDPAQRYADGDDVAAAFRDPAAAARTAYVAPVATPATERTQVIPGVAPVPVPDPTPTPAAPLPLEEEPPQDLAGRAAGARARRGDRGGRGAGRDLRRRRLRRAGAPTRPRPRRRRRRRPARRPRRARRPASRRRRSGSTRATTSAARSTTWPPSCSDLGLEVDTQPVDNPDGEEADSVASIKPTSGLVEGDTVVVEYYREAEPTEEPTPSETPSPTPSETPSATPTPSQTPTESTPPATDTESPSTSASAPASAAAAPVSPSRAGGAR